MLLYMTCEPYKYISLNTFISDIEDFDNNSPLFPFYINELNIEGVFKLRSGLNVRRNIDQHLLLWIMHNFNNVNCIEGGKCKETYEYKTHPCFLNACIDYFNNNSESREMTIFFYSRCICETYASFFLEYNFYEIKYKDLGPYNMLLSFYDWFNDIEPKAFTLPP